MAAFAPNSYAEKHEGPQACRQAEIKRNGPILEDNFFSPTGHENSLRCDIDGEDISRDTIDLGPPAAGVAFGEDDKGALQGD